MVSWHLFKEVLGWVAVLLVSIVLIFKEIPILDSLLSILITSYVLYNVINNLKEVLAVFLQGVPEGLSIDKVEQEITENTDAKSVHHTNLWSLEGEKNLLSTYIVVNNDVTKEQQVIELKNNVKELMDKEEIEHVTIEVE